MELIQRMKAQAEGYGQIIGHIIDAIAVAIQEEDDLEIYTSGATNLLKYPELGDREKASELLYTMEEKKALSELIVDQEDSGEENKNRFRFISAPNLR